MKKKTTMVKSIFRRTCAVIGTAALISGIHNTANATQTVRELFDGLNAGHDYSSLDGQTNDVTTLGLQGYWTNSPAGSTGIVYKDTWSLDWPISPYEYDGTLLEHSAGQNGLLNFNSGGNLNTLIDPNTGNPYGNQTSQSYATHPLAPGAYVSFTNNGTYYFSVRIEKSYPWSVGDSSAGFGLATGNGTNDHFVGFGVLRPSCLLADSVTDIGNASYVTAGTLGQPGISSHPDDTGGPYYPNAYSSAGLWTVGDGVHAGLLVGRLTTTSSGASTLDVKSFLRNGPAIDTDPSLIVWDATYNFSETNTMTQLLVWMHGQNVEYDAIRVGTMYGDVIGFELIGAPKGSPGNTVYAGTTVTISQNASLNNGTFPMSFQWLSNSVPVTDATNSTLVLANPTVAATADYSVIASNFYEMATSAVTHITVNPAVSPFFTAKPVSITRYVGSPAATFKASVDGTPPFTYQWQHAGTNIGSATITANQNNTLVLPPITLADAGNYSVIVTNAFGSTNSGNVTLTEIAPSAGSYAAAVTALSPWGYWRLDDLVTSNNPLIYDQWGDHQGQAVDVNNLIFGAAGSTYVGFSQPHLASVVNQTGGPTIRLNLAKLPYYTNTMTFTMWVNGGCQFVNHNGYNSGWGLEDNGGSLQFDWNGYDPNGKNSVTWNSGLSSGGSGWKFVALVVEPTQATVYVGTSQFSLVSATSGLLATANGAFTNSDSTTIGDTAGLYPFGVGRNQWPWADDGNGAPWATDGGTWSDVAIYYQSLTPTQIQNLYLAGVGLAVQGTPDGSGNLILNWIPVATLQEASSITGPWTDVGGSPTPPYNVPMSAAQKFYRVRN
ncbi:MAG: hypothetical protein JF609_10350 [Verrucomicrobia bacterium]|nr:hypothetical protein [Verrucomicrobiota bacterium]